jgi:hypothetical protein
MKQTLNNECQVLFFLKIINIAKSAICFFQQQAVEQALDCAEVSPTD